MDSSEKIGVRSMGIDWWTVLIYLLLVFFGWINIYAAVYNDDHSSIFDIGQRYGKQMFWIGISLFVAISIVLIDGKYYHMLAYPFFWFMLLIMTLVLLFGNETNGAKSWLVIAGGIKIQPVEFMKIATALALARYMSSYHFNIGEFRSVYYIGLIILAPVMVILMQNDTGSALVFLGFFVMLYREGFGKMLYLLTGFVVMLGILSFLLEPVAMLLIIMVACLSTFMIVNRQWRESLRYVSMVLLVALGLIWFMPLYWALLIPLVLTLPLLVLYAHRQRISNLMVTVGVFIGALLFTFFVDYAFDNILQLHQQKRILDLLGIENDQKGWGYNVIQSKIAIGSGGLSGKGFLNGTQTKFSFVPEQDTDFIFCTVGEEWGFMGSMSVVILFGLLISRLMIMGERQKEPFARVYCYSVASILLTHFVINVCMTIGLFPVVGIPLPFFSYGGSSLLAFTVLLFIAVRLDSAQNGESGRRLL